MTAPSTPKNEQERLSALGRYDILDTEPDVEFDDITTMVAEIFAVPFALISFVDADRLWLKSRYGLDGPSELPRSVSFCAHTILAPDQLLVVPDAACDERFADNPLVTGAPYIRSYTGVSLCTQDGFALGALCLLDTRPRQFTPTQLQTLRMAGRAVFMLLEQRRRIEQLRLATSEQRRVEGELRAEIAHRRYVEERLSFSSSHDELTQLPNRAEFVTRLERAVERRGMHGSTPFAVLFIDLDRFKHINDTLGHLAGDALLVEIAQRLQAVTRTGDVVARLGGDEFTMLVHGAGDEASARTVAERAASVLASKFQVAGAEMSCTASIGIVLVDDAYAGTKEILRDADIAMYASKERGRNRCTVFTRALRDVFAQVSEMQLALRTALDCDQFTLAYQPIVSLQSGHHDPVGFEALLRWEQDGQLLGAAAFIEAAEQTGLIVELGDRVLRDACAQAYLWQKTFPQPIVTAINVSARQLAEPGFAAKVKEIVRTSGVDPQRIALEVTESIMIAEVDASIALIAELRNFGLRVYLDDFGTGYSSLNYLRRFPLDRIKIDRSFVSGAGDDLADPVIIHSIISLAHKLDLHVVAEGVETERQLAALVALNCDYAQGYLFSRAVHVGAATELLCVGESVADTSAA